MADRSGMIHHRIRTLFTRTIYTVLAIGFSALAFQIVNAA